MAKRCINRLSALGAAAQVDWFVDDMAWDAVLKSRFGEFLERCEGRYVCQFETDDAPLEPLRELSLLCPGLNLILDYEIEESAIKGLAMAKGGKLHHCQINY
jgi:hypothetical protein